MDLDIEFKETFVNCGAYYFIALCVWHNSYNDIKPHKRGMGNRDIMNYNIEIPWYKGKIRTQELAERTLREPTFRLKHSGKKGLPSYLNMLSFIQDSYTSMVTSWSNGRLCAGE